MKYSLKCLDKAILTILPHSDKFPSGIGGIDRITKMEMCAKQIFVYPEKFTDTDMLFASHVIRLGMIDLAAEGCMLFGDVDDFWM